MSTLFRTRGIRLSFDPEEVYGVFSGGGMFTLSDNRVSLVLNELLETGEMDPLTLHELRHSQYHALRMSGVDSPFHTAAARTGDSPMSRHLFATPYEDFLSFEEVSTYTFDLRLFAARARHLVSIERSRMLGTLRDHLHYARALTLAAGDVADHALQNLHQGRDVRIHKELQARKDGALQAMFSGLLETDRFELNMPLATRAENGLAEKVMAIDKILGLPPPESAVPGLKAQKAALLKELSTTFERNLKDLRDRTTRLSLLWDAAEAVFTRAGARDLSSDELAKLTQILSQARGLTLPSEAHQP